MSTFSVSILLPVVNETFSLKQTVEIIEASSASYVAEYLVITCKKTTAESRKAIEELKQKYGSKVVVLEQTLPFLGGAVRDAFDACKGTNVIMMASDMETDPNDVKTLIAEQLKNPEMIITATRWKGGAGFKGYNPLKLVLNYTFQKIFSVMYGVNLSDMTYGYRIFPSKLVKSIQWEEVRHPLLFETVLKPLRLGVKVKEIPSSWKARQEGESMNTFFRNFEYFKTGWRIRFYDKSKILKKEMS